MQQGSLEYRSEIAMQQKLILAPSAQSKIRPTGLGQRAYGALSTVPVFFREACVMIDVVWSEMMMWKEEVVR